MAERCLRAAQSAGDPALLLPAHQIYGAGLIGMGDSSRGLEHLDAAIAIYDPSTHDALTYIYGHHPAIVWINSSWALWFLGYPDQARQRYREGLAIADKVKHPYTSVFFAGWAAFLFCFCGDSRAVEDLASAMITISTERGFSFYRVWGMIFHGWAMTQQDQITDGIAKMREGLNEYRAADGRILLSPFLGLLADAHGKAGQIEEALNVLAEAQAFAEESDERLWQAELYRLRGELILKTARIGGMARSDEDEAEGCFRRALATAQAQKAKSLELRAATSLSGLWLRQSKRHEARRALEKILGSFTEGFDTPDLRKARFLLEEL
jgi:predicted ATPase